MAEFFFFPARIGRNNPCNDPGEDSFELYSRKPVNSNPEQKTMHGEKYFRTVVKRSELDTFADEFLHSDQERRVVSYTAEKSGRKQQRFKMPRLMGVVNCTPDSFYPGSRYNFTQPTSIESIIEMRPDILDFGGESTRPNAEPISSEEEVKRILPLVRAVSEETKIPISIDTRNPETLQRMVEFGIQIANDISGLEKSSMRALVRENNLEAVVMHSRGTPATMQSLAHYDDLIAEVVEYFFDRLFLCVQDGIEPGKIILDPGLGFAKTWKDNLTILENIRCLDLGFPVLVGASRKSFIGHITEKKVEDRLPGTIAASLYLAHNGVDILRVHDVHENRDALDLIRSIHYFGRETL